MLQGLPQGALLVSLPRAPQQEEVVLQQEPNGELQPEPSGEPQRGDPLVYVREPFQLLLEVATSEPINACATTYPTTF